MPQMTWEDLSVRVSTSTRSKLVISSRIVRWCWWN